MARIISASIDVTKIDKAKLVDGKKGEKYLNLTIIVNDEQNKYGQDTSITEGQTKEEREAKAEKKYLGNGKTVWQSDQKQHPSVSNQNTDTTSGPTDDLPF